MTLPGSHGDSVAEQGIEPDSDPPLCPYVLFENPHTHHYLASEPLVNMAVPSQHRSDVRKHCCTHNTDEEVSKERIMACPRPHRKSVAEDRTNQAQHSSFPGLCPGPSTILFSLTACFSSDLPWHRTGVTQVKKRSAVRESSPLSTLCRSIQCLPTSAKAPLSAPARAPGKYRAPSSGTKYSYILIFDWCICLLDRTTQSTLHLGLDNELYFHSS